MEPLSRDTPLEVEQVWLEMMRQRGPLWRLRRAADLTSLCWRAAKIAVHRANPEASAMELERILLTIRYGGELADEVVRVKKERGFYD